MHNRCTTRMNWGRHAGVLGTTCGWRNWPKVLCSQVLCCSSQRTKHPPARRNDEPPGGRLPEPRRTGRPDRRGGTTKAAGGRTGGRYQLARAGAGHGAASRRTEVGRQCGPRRLGQPRRHGKQRSPAAGPATSGHRAGQPQGRPAPELGATGRTTARRSGTGAQDRKAGQPQGRSTRRPRTEGQGSRKTGRSPGPPDLQAGRPQGQPAGRSTRTARTEQPQASASSQLGLEGHGIERHRQPQGRRGTQTPTGPGGHPQGQPPGPGTERQGSREAGRPAGPTGRSRARRKAQPAPTGDQVGRAPARAAGETGPRGLGRPGRRRKAAPGAPGPSRGPFHLLHGRGLVLCSGSQVPGYGTDTPVLTQSDRPLTTPGGQPSRAHRFHLAHLIHECRQRGWQRSSGGARCPVRAHERPLTCLPS